MNEPLKKTCLITGACGYIGKLITAYLIKENWHIIGTTTSSNRTSYDQIKYVTLDLLKTHSLESGLQIIADTKLDAIIHCAGFSPDFNVLKLTSSEFSKAFNINFNSVVQLNNFLVKQLNKNGHIIHFGSRVALQGNRGQIAYATSKGLLIDYTKQLAISLGNIPIKVNMILPGVHPSKMLGDHAETIIDNAKKNSCLHQLTSINDVINCVSFLLNSETISGQLFSIESRSV